MVELIEEIKRVRQYAVAKEMHQTVADCDLLLEFLKVNSRA